MHVAPGSAGERAGIREEDVIASIDGRKAAEWTLSAILSLFEKPLPHRVRIRRNGKELEIAFTPGELV
jgi:S1-C subfamily serine protease